MDDSSNLPSLSYSESNSTPPPLPERNSHHASRFRTSDLLTATPDMAKRSFSRANSISGRRTRHSDTGDDSSCSEVVKVMNVRNILQLSKASPDLDSTSQRPSSLQQLQNLDMFKFPANEGPQSDSDSFMLETDQYVRQMKQRRVDLMSKFDSSAADRLRRKVGYEIEKRLVKALQARTIKKKRHKPPKSAKNVNSMMYHMYKSKSTLRMGSLSRNKSPETERRRRHKRYRTHHRFCLKCLSSSFGELFRILAHPMQYTRLRRSPDYWESTLDSVRLSQLHHPEQRRARNAHNSDTDNTRFPTAKMLLNVQDGKIQWPVFQYGGTSGSGMLISTGKMYSATPRYINPQGAGRENFSLGAQVDPGDPPQSQTQLNATTKQEGTNTDAYDNLDKSNGLVGWLQVRDVKNRRHYVQVVDPAPQGPFRKLPWNPSGTFHVMKF